MSTLPAPGPIGVRNSLSWWCPSFVSCRRSSARRASAPSRTEEACAESKRSTSSMVATKRRSSPSSPRVSPDARMIGARFRVLLEHPEPPPRPCLGFSQWADARLRRRAQLQPRERGQARRRRLCPPALPARPSRAHRLVGKQTRPLDQPAVTRTAVFKACFFAARRARTRSSAGTASRMPLPTSPARKCGLQILQ